MDVGNPTNVDRGVQSTSIHGLTWLKFYECVRTHWSSIRMVEIRFRVREGRVSLLNRNSIFGENFYYFCEKYLQLPRLIVLKSNDVCL